MSGKTMKYAAALAACALVQSRSPCQVVMGCTNCVEYGRKNSGVKSSNRCPISPSRLLRPGLLRSWLLSSRLWLPLSGLCVPYRGYAYPYYPYAYPYHYLGFGFGWGGW
jgi:hypothetical protein